MKFLKPSELSSIDKVLVIRFGGLGDILHSTPVLRSIKRELKSCRITYLLGKGSERVLEGNPNVDDIIVFDKKGRDRGLKGLLKLIAHIRSRNYDLIINLHPNFRTFMILLFSKAKFKIVYKKDKEPKGKIRVRHAIENIGDVLKPLNIELKERKMDLKVSWEGIKKINEILKEKGIGEGDKVVVINPSSTHEVNRWGEKRFAELCDRLMEKGRYRVILVSAPNEVEIVRRIKGYMKYDPIDLSGIDLDMLISLLKRADLVISGDTGPLHMAVALGTRVIGLYGPTDPYRTGPIGGNNLVIYKDELECVPCRKRRCDRGHECMELISSEEVLEKIEEIGGI